MDGYAVRWAEVATAREAPGALPVVGEIPAGRTDVVPLAPGTVQRIMTGAPCPPAPTPSSRSSGPTAAPTWSRSATSCRRGSTSGAAGEDVAAGDVR